MAICRRRGRPARRAKAIFGFGLVISKRCSRAEHFNDRQFVPLCPDFVEVLGTRRCVICAQQSCYGFPKKTVFPGLSSFVPLLKT